MVIIGANQDTVFSRLAEAMGRAEWATDPKYATHNARGENQEELDNLIADWTKTLTSEKVLEICGAYGVPSGKLYRAPEMLEDPHFAAREAIVEVPFPEVGYLKMQNVFPKFSETPGSVRWAGPELGEHNEEIYKEKLGFSDGEYDALLKAGHI
jgi:succinyl-CoA---D-citramalate CoA-transferase